MSTRAPNGSSPLPLDIEMPGNSMREVSAPGNCPQAEQQSAAKRKRRLLAGRVLTAFSGLFLVFDGISKLVMPAPVVDASTRLGFPLIVTPGVGFLLLVCTFVYLMPRTAVFGAVLLTGYLGGAVAIQLRAGSPTFETVFPVLTAILVWAGVYLRECRLSGIFPIRR